MKMPDVIYASKYAWDDGNGSLVTNINDIFEGSEQYHHSRIVEALKAENEGLKAKLDKAKNTLKLYGHDSCPITDYDNGQRARTTLEEI